jgi:hypothetical protein
VAVGPGQSSGGHRQLLRAIGGGVPAGFPVVAVLVGAGEFTAADGAQPVTRADVLAVPYDAGDWTLRGDVEAVVCRPALVAPGADRPRRVTARGPP